MSGGSKQEIMEATHKALCRHGYADLSIQKIANEFDKGKSLIYYHYDDKQDLMLSFLDHMNDMVQKEFEEISDLGPDERLDSMLDMALAINDDEMWEFRKALIEVKAQTPYNDELAEKFQEIDQIILDEFKEVLQVKGIENADATAELLISTMDGIMNRKVSYRDREGLEDLRDRLKSIISKLDSSVSDNR